jgi:hypothetical protein
MFTQPTEIAMENLARFIAQVFGLRRAVCNDSHMKVLKHWTGLRLKFVFDGHHLHFLTTIGNGPVVIPQTPVAVSLEDGTVVKGTCHFDKGYACTHFRFTPCFHDMVLLLKLVNEAVTHTAAETSARM